MNVAHNVKQVLSELPAGVQLLVAAKTRSPTEITEAIETGVTMLGDVI